MYLYTIKLMRDLKEVKYNVGPQEYLLHQRRQLQNKADLITSPMRLIQAVEQQGSRGPRINADGKEACPAAVRCFEFSPAPPCHSETGQRVLGWVRVLGATGERSVIGERNCAEAVWSNVLGQDPSGKEQGRLHGRQLANDMLRQK